MARVWRNVKSRFLMVQRDVVLKAAEAVFRDLSLQDTQYSLMDVRRVVVNAFYAVKDVSAGEDARSHRMDCPSAHVVGV